MDYRIEFAYTSHRGNLRGKNQDNLFCDGFFLPADHDSLPSVFGGRAGPGDTRLFAVFDGIGGEQCGETASRLAAETLAGRSLDRREQSLAEACMEGNRRIVRFAEENRLKACGTTAAMLLLDPEGAAWCSIGDSRICLIRDGAIQRLTEDDVFPAAGKRKPPLLQFLGIPEQNMRIEPHTGTGTVRRGDVYVLCTDGLTDMVPEQSIPAVIRGASPPDAGGLLLRKALAAGGRDNITFFLICIL